MAEESRQIPAELFEELWRSSFLEVARNANESDAYTARRFILESRLAEATVSMVTWTKWGVLVALLTGALSLAIGVLGN